MRAALLPAAWAVVLRELRVQRRYPISMVNLVLLTPLYEMALPTLLLGTAFLVDGSAVGLARLVGTDDLAGWLGLGVMTASMTVGAVWSVSGTLYSDRDTGALEHNWASPAPRESYVVGAVLTGTIFTLAASALLLAFAITFLGASYDPLGALWSVPVAAVMVVGNCGFGYLTAAAVLVLRRADALLKPATLLVVTFSGVTFPLLLLPPAARLPTYLLPGTWGVDLLRQLTLDSTPLQPVPVELAGLVATSVVTFGFGRRMFLRAERRLRTTGALSQF